MSRCERCAARTKQAGDHLCEECAKRLCRSTNDPFWGAFRNHPDWELWPRRGIINPENPPELRPAQRGGWIG